jgi:hypothetical protein
MNAGPDGTPPEETPSQPPQEPQTPAEAPGFQPPPAPGPEPGYAAGYYPPPGYAAGPPPRRSAAPLIAGVIVAVLVVAAIGAYIVGGYAYATTRLNSANASYNKVVDHLNSLNDTVNGLSDQLTNTNAAAASSGDLQSDQKIVGQIVTKSQAAQAQIDQDDSSLAQAQSGLQQNQWLTLTRKSDIDKALTRIGHERKALSIAKEITNDYVQIGAFYQTFFDVAIDVDTLGTKAQASDVTGAAAADEKLKTDTAKAITQDKAPGLPAEMDTFLKDIAALANDFSSVVNAKSASEQSTADAALQADAKKIQDFDFNKISTAVHDYYQPLLDSYNSEVDKANGK